MSRTHGAVGKMDAKTKVMRFRCTEAEYAKIQRLLVNEDYDASNLRGFILKLADTYLKN